LVGEAILTEFLLLQAHRTAGVATFKAFPCLNLFSHHSTVFPSNFRDLLFFSVPCVGVYVCVCIKNKQQQSVPHDPRQRSIVCTEQLHCSFSVSSAPLKNSILSLSPSLPRKLSAFVLLTIQRHNLLARYQPTKWRMPQNFDLTIIMRIAQIITRCRNNY
jgi:hypothetical protein